eukprot:319252_1
MSRRRQLRILSLLVLFFVFVEAKKNTTVKALPSPPKSSTKGDGSKSTTDDKKEEKKDDPKEPPEKYPFPGGDKKLRKSLMKTSSDNIPIPFDRANEVVTDIAKFKHDDSDKVVKKRKDIYKIGASMVNSWMNPFITWMQDFLSCAIFWESFADSETGFIHTVQNNLFTRRISKMQDFWKFITDPYGIFKRIGSAYFDKYERFNDLLVLPFDTDLYQRQLQINQMRNAVQGLDMQGLDPRKLNPFPAPAPRKWVKDSVGPIKQCYYLVKYTVYQFAVFGRKDETNFYSPECRKGQIRWKLQKFTNMISKRASKVPGVKAFKNFNKRVFAGIKNGWSAVKKQWWKFIDNLPASKWTFGTFFRWFNVEAHLRNFFYSSIDLDDIDTVGEGCVAAGYTTVDEVAYLNLTALAFDSVIDLPKGRMRRWRHALVFARNTESLRVSEMRCGCKELGFRRSAGSKDKWITMDPFELKTSTFVVAAVPHGKLDVSGWIVDPCTPPAMAVARSTRLQLRNGSKFSVKHLYLGDYAFVRFGERHFGSGSCLYVSNQATSRPFTLGIYVKMPSGCTQMVKKTISAAHRMQYLGNYGGLAKGSVVYVYISSSGSNHGKSISFVVAECGYTVPELEKMEEEAVANLPEEEKLDQKSDGSAAASNSSSRSPAIFTTIILVLAALFI